MGDDPGLPAKGEISREEGVPAKRTDENGRKNGPASAEKLPRYILERYRALFNRSLVCLYVHDLEGNFLDANQTALNMLGHERQDISSMNLASLLSEDQLPEAFETL